MGWPHTSSQRTLTRDGIAPIRKSEENRHLLPATSRWVLVEGGNHSQFGWYGFQPLDHFATIDRDRQQELTRKAIVDALESVAHENARENCRKVGEPVVEHLVSADR